MCRTLGFLFFEHGAYGVGVEFGFKQERVVAFVGMDGDVFRLNSIFYELFMEVFLFVRIEADVRVDTEYKVFLMLAITEDLCVGLCSAVARKMIVGPTGNEVEIGVGIEAP